MDQEGTATAIYSDSLAGLIEEGKATIKRASNVEPDERGQWWAHIRYGGLEESLGPYRLREEALAAEVKELEEYLFEEVS